MAERILMIDDDDRLAGMVSDYLGGAGFRLTIAGTARDGEALLKRESFDAVILDLMLPDADGLDLCRRLRASTDVPILMLTARGEPMDRVVGLEIGADDYLAKPFEVPELLARIEALLRRAKATHKLADSVFSFDDLTVDFRRKEVTRRGQVIELSAREFQLLSYLIAHRQDRPFFILCFQTGLDASGMHHDRQYLAAWRPELLLEKRFLDLPSVGTQQAEPGKQRAFDLSRKPDGEAKQVRGNLGARVG